METESDQVGSHHGVPYLMNRDIGLLRAYTKWVETVRKEDRYGKNWIPGEIDWLKSRLFWRIRSGKDPLPSPPPTCFSCPWYEVIENEGPHTSIDPVHAYMEDGKKVASVAQCRYEVESEEMDGFRKTVILRFGPYRFKAWNDWVECTSIKPGGHKSMVAHIQLIKETA